MKEFVAEVSFGDDKLSLHEEPTNKSNQHNVQVIASEPSISTNGGLNDYSDDDLGREVELNPLDDWLPITESRNGSIYSVVFHLLCSGIGFPALLLPLAFASLGWAWGIICLSLAFAWQLYTIWLLVQLAESVPGTRYSRYLHLSVAAFGPKLGKLLAIFPVMYLSGGSCAMLIITGGGSMELFVKTICSGGGTCIDEATALTGAAWFILFTCVAIVVAQFPNLNSLAKVSMIGAITAVGYCSLIWVLSIIMGRPGGVSYHSAEMAESDMAKFGNILNAIGIIVLAFRGHNLVLEIQGTLPSSRKHPSWKFMWRGVTISYLIIAMCLFPLAIAGFWSYGNKVPTNGGMLGAFLQIHGHESSKSLMGIIYLLIAINSLSSFAIYAMPVFDNLEFRYTIKKKKSCPGWVRTGLRVFFGGVVLLVAVAFPFLGSLAALIGGIALPLTYVYPCFMYIWIRKPCPLGLMWWTNMGLGCLGMILSFMLVVAAVWNLDNNGLDANFFRP